MDCNNITNSTDAMLILRQSLGLDMSGTGWCIVSGKVPDWSAIKNGAKFVVYDSTYDEPYIQPINVRGWEDGLYITRDGLNL